MRNIADNDKLVAKAKGMQESDRSRIISSFKETDLHQQLRKLFSAIHPDREVLITHGSDEYGKDLVMIDRDPVSASATAMVVKRGNVTANANGPISEIKDQVSMALAHPYTPDGIEQIPILKVLVVTSGRISDNAKTRIQKELQVSNVDFVPISRLVSLFTEYYPRVFFGGERYDFYSERIQSLETSHMFAERGIDLSDCFIEPRLSEVSPLVGERKGTRTRRRVSFSSLVDRIKHPVQLMLIGDAGCGKSAILKKISIDSMTLTRDGSVKDDIEEAIAVYCPATTLEEQNAPELIEGVVRRECSVPGDVAIAQLLVDGLDEVPPDKRVSIANALAEYSSATRTAVVVSSRHREPFDGDLDAWHAIEVEPLSVESAIALSERVFSDPHVKNALKEGVGDVARSIDITPLAVFLLASVIEQRQEIPASLTELYDQYTDLVLGKEDRDKGIESLFEYEVKKRFLAELAYQHFEEGGNTSITDAVFERFGLDYIADHGLPPNWGTLLDELKRSCLLDYNSDSGEFVFRHRSFLEFFLAYYLHTALDADTVPKAVDLYFNQLWSDAAFYFFGLKKQLSREAIDAVFAHADDSPWGLVCKMRAGRLVQAGWLSGKEVKKAGIELAGSYAQRIRDSYLSFAESGGGKDPRIVADILVMTLAADSFQSVFLLPQAEDILEEPIPNDEAGLLARLCLLSAISPMLDQDLRKLLVDEYGDKVNIMPNKEFVGRGMFYLLVAAEADEAIKKSVNRKLRAFARKHTDVFRGLLPSSKKD